MKYALYSTFLLVLMSACSKPVAKFEVQNPETPAPVAVEFQNTSTDAESYEWDFGDGQTSTEASPTHTYERFGTFVVKLKAMQGEAVSVDSMELTIPEPPRRKVKIETPMGDMVMELSNYTPLHRDNFIKLVESDYYDGLLFHRVISNFMIQGGDPDSRDAPAGVMLGMGGPSYTIPAEIVPELIHQKGAVAAARLGDAQNPQKASSGSQFYLVQGQPVASEMLGQLETQRGFRYTAEQRQTYASTPGTPFLDREYTVFGQVVEGLDVIDKIALVEKAPGDRPLEAVWMKLSMIE